MQYVASVYKYFLFLILLPLQSVFGVEEGLINNIQSLCSIEKIENCIVKENNINWDAQNKKGQPLFHIMIEKSSSVSIGSTIKNHLNLLEQLNTKGETPIYTAVRVRRLDIVKQLLDLGANINAQNKRGDTPLLVALYTKSFSIVYYLLLDPLLNLSLKNKDDITSLHIMSYMGASKAIINSLNNHSFKKLNINAQDKDGLTPLHYSTGNGHIQTTQLLLEQGADFSLKDNIGNTPVHNAVLSGKYEIFQLFQEKKGVFELLGENNNTLLHTAILSGNKLVIHYFLDYDNHLLFNAQNTYKKTPLALAQERLDDSIIKVLLHKTDLSITNKNGQSPIMQVLSIQRKSLYADYFHQPYSYQSYDNKGNNLLHYCAKYKVILCTFKNTSLSNKIAFHKNLLGQTPWDISIEKNYLGMVNYYLKTYPKTLLKQVQFKKLELRLKKEKKYALAKAIHSFYEKNKHFMVQKKHKKRPKKYKK